MKFLSNVLKTLSTLDLHVEKKRQIWNGISQYFIHWSICELFYSSLRKKQIETTGIPTFSTRSLSVHFSSKFKWGSIFCDSQR